MPPVHIERLAEAARAARARMNRSPDPIETLLIAGGQHSWLYEFPEYRARCGAVPGAGAAAAR